MSAKTHGEAKYSKCSECVKWMKEALPLYSSQRYWFFFLFFFSVFVDDIMVQLWYDLQWAAKMIYRHKCAILSDFRIFLLLLQSESGCLMDLELGVTTICLNEVTSLSLSLTPFTFSGFIFIRRCRCRCRCRQAQKFFKHVHDRRENTSISTDPLSWWLIIA